ncbi:MAG: cobalamin-binding protein [Gammaproteobacteria bacterium]|nr:cobalamin-binding protein [Gammaproteobacteria bacterium]MBT3869778.1 cobalamin-binding protein [Gammaproteobacteria bacterium]MBT4377257.1 cobalamin-binding protein [Gammaproteobacteria bacterium]MBT4618338.1 cobalamin-binding protein [Gammaproteobacteria bacterium]MBT5198542.1 cobalamin-binding protein [Gammaproteobacteria bacterium]
MTVFADITVVDDSGTTVVLAEPAGKIVSLSPHLTELLFSLGVGDRIEATVDFSDYPEAALNIPRLGNAFSVSVEAVIEQSPDLIVAWMTGGNHRTFEQLRALGYPVFVNEASSLVGIAAAVQQLGILVGKPERGLELAEKFRVDLQRLRQSSSGAGSPKVFFQISDAQLYTVNSQHLIGQAIEVCGAENIFSDVEFFVPMVSYESVVERNPDVLVVSSPYPGYKSAWYDRWNDLGWGGRVRTIDASLITRPSLRMLEGIKMLCETLGQ